MDWTFVTQNVGVWLRIACAIGIVGLVYERKKRFKWKLPERLFGKDCIISIDCHCGGLPARVIIEGLPGQSKSVRSCEERREYLMNNCDAYRKLIITEPRGYPCQNVDFVYPATPAYPQAKFSYIIGENNFVYPMMSGHNTICVCTALLETGLVQMTEPVTKFDLEAPAGLISIRAECSNGKAKTISFRNTPAFVECLDLVITVPFIGEVVVDIAFGGMWYCIVDLEHELNQRNEKLKNIRLEPEFGGDIVKYGEMIKVASREQHPVFHPIYNYAGCDIMAFRSTPSTAGRQKYGCDLRNAVVMSTGDLDWSREATFRGNIDRSPCGTGTSAIMATMHARGQLGVGKSLTNESIVGSVFVGKILEETQVAGRRAIIPEITGSAVITQFSKIVVDDFDPFPEGFTVGDIWAN